MSHLDLSEIHSSLMSSFILGMILRTSPVLWVMTMLLPTQSNTSTVSVFLVSQGRAMKAYGLLVRAPTGHRSTKKVIKIHEHKLSNLIPITFPDSSLRSILSTYIPICMLLPRPVVPRSSTPATSEANLTHLVHWMHLHQKTILIEKLTKKNEHKIMKIALIVSTMTHYLKQLCILYL